jgi:hypothetical protein
VQQLLVARHQHRDHHLGRLAVLRIEADAVGQQGQRDDHARQSLERRMRHGDAVLQTGADAALACEERLDGIGAPRCREPAGDDHRLRQHLDQMPFVARGRGDQDRRVVKVVGQRHRAAAGRIPPGSAPRETDGRRDRLLPSQRPGSGRFRTPSPLP